MLPIDTWNIKVAKLTMCTKYSTYHPVSADQVPSLYEVKMKKINEAWEGERGVTHYKIAVSKYSKSISGIVQFKKKTSRVIEIIKTKT